MTARLKPRTPDVPLSKVKLTFVQRDLMLLTAAIHPVERLTLDNGRKLQSLDVLCDYGLATGGNHALPDGRPYMKLTARGHQWVAGYKRHHWGR